MAINWTDFEKVEMHTGCIIEAKVAIGVAKPAFRLQIDFGDKIGIKKSSAQICDLYNEEDLIGKMIIAVTNFPPKQIGQFMSEVLVLGVLNALGQIVLLSTDQLAEKGQRVF